MKRTLVLVARRSAHRHASLVSTCGSSSGSSRPIAGYDVCLVTANSGQWASPDEFSITVGGRYVREKNPEFSLRNRNTGLKIGRLPQKSGWLAALYVPFYLKFWDKLTHPYKSDDFQYAHTASAVTPCEKSSIITNRKSTTSFPMSLRQIAYVAISPTLQCVCLR